MVTRRWIKRLLWIPIFLLGTTFMFWGMIQTQLEVENEVHQAMRPQNKQTNDLNHGWAPDTKRSIKESIVFDRNLIPGDNHEEYVVHHIKRVQTSKPATLRLQTNKPPDPNPIIHTNHTATAFKLPLDLRPFKPVHFGSPVYLKPPKSNRMWPQPGDTEDRIMAQMNIIPDNPKLNDTQNEKTILIYHGFPDGIPDGREVFRRDECPVTNCRLTEDRDLIENAHAVVFQNNMYSRPRYNRSTNQIWILYILESPENIYDLSECAGMFNWTATYRLDSTINTPYERFVPFANMSNSNLPPVKYNHGQNKTKKVAWFVSNCYTSNGRLEYAKELGQYIEVDIYGACGTMDCYRTEQQKCNILLQKDYKFYLAFENSNCQDYITEKFYWNALYNNVVPIVMGARPEDYAKVAPPHSYIHIDDYESPKELARYLDKLDQNDDLYNEYFRWKGTGEFINTKFWCRLCSLVHEIDNKFVPAKNKFSMWYENLHKWWRGPGVCVHPEPGKLWASWRNRTGFTNKEQHVKFVGDTLQYGPYIDKGMVDLW